MHARPRDEPLPPLLQPSRVRPQNHRGRVQYPSLRSLAAGGHIRFVCDTDEALTRVERVAHYSSFEQMLDTEDPERVSPDSSHEQQLADIRKIYGPEKEALGVLAIEIELI